MQTIVTNHAKRRLKERLGTSKNSATKIAQRALKLGLHHKDAVGELKEYLSKLFLSHRNANNMRIYAEKVFLFCKNVLITIIELPNEFKKNNGGLV